MSNKPMCGVRDEHATANCCRTALNMTGWKDEGEKLYLIAMIDDATSRLTARFVRHDSTEENLRQLAIYVEQHGDRYRSTPIKLVSDGATSHPPS